MERDKIVSAAVEAMDEMAEEVKSIASDLAENKETRLNFAESALMFAMESFKEESRRKTRIIWVLIGVLVFIMSFWAATVFYFISRDMVVIEQVWEWQWEGDDGQADMTAI